MNIDCQIREKSDIYEALSTMCEVDIMITGALLQKKY